MADPISITYDYKFNSGAEKRFDIRLDKDTLALNAKQPADPPSWTLLEFYQCGNCPLNRGFNLYCPVAVNLSAVTREFRDVTAADKAAVTVTVKERAYFKATSIQEGLSPLLGIIMTTSGCPVMEPLKPMVRYHLPFASLDETVFRMITMFLLSQFIRQQAGKEPQWDLAGLSAIY